jgi:hypothetical protein
MNDFTTKSLEKLLTTLKSEGYLFNTISEYFDSTNFASRVILLRHDVEDRYENALRFARLEHSLGLKGTYYFRFIEDSFNASMISSIAGMGHEVGYHYDDLSACKGNYEEAIKRFEYHVKLLATIAPVKTICMEGNPLSKFDNRDLWKKYNYRDFGITTEPYFDIDFNEVAYFTDTGRRWNGSRFSLRDKVNSRYHFNFKTTFDIIENIGQLPAKAMFTFHPQRWNDNLSDWTKELVLQNLKNQVKFFLSLR